MSEQKSRMPRIVESFLGFVIRILACSPVLLSLVGIVWILHSFGFGHSFGDKLFLVLLSLIAAHGLFDLYYWGKILKEREGIPFGLLVTFGYFVMFIGTIGIISMAVRWIAGSFGFALKAELIVWLAFAALGLFTLIGKAYGFLKGKKEEPEQMEVSNGKQGLSEDDVIEHLLEHYGAQCQGCKRVFDSPRFLHLDFNTLEAPDGRNHISNMLLLCGPCFGMKSVEETLEELRSANKASGWMLEGEFKRDILQRPLAHASPGEASK